MEFADIYARRDAILQSKGRGGISLKELRHYASRLGLKPRALKKDQLIDLIVQRLDSKEVAIEKPKVTFSRDAIAGSKGRQGLSFKDLRKYASTLGLSATKLKKDALVEALLHRLDQEKSSPPKSPPKSPVKSKKKLDDCCICMEPIQDESEMTECGHAICGECSKLLEKAECPMCRAPLKGKLYDPESLKKIAEKEAKTREIENIVNDLKAYYSYGDNRGDYPVTNPENIQMRAEAQGLGDAFRSFVESNTELPTEEYRRIFLAYKIYYFKYHPIRYDKNGDLEYYSFDEAMKEFHLMGLTLLYNPDFSFNDALAAAQIGPAPQTGGRGGGRGRGRGGRRR